jgi:flagellar biosynthesis regulator FlaF
MFEAWQIHPFIIIFVLLHESDISQLSSESFDQLIDITSELFIVDPETA